MFELKIVESDDSEGTAVAIQQAIFRWSIRLTFAGATWLAFNGLLEQRPVHTYGLVRLRERLPAGYHLFCDKSGRCGVHDGEHRVPPSSHP